jgi:transposase-like protein
MTKTQVEVITSVERRRRWSRAEKERIVAAATEPGAVASAVAREAGSMRASCIGGGRSCVVRRAQRRALPR